MFLIFFFLPLIFKNMRKKVGKLLKDKYSSTSSIASLSISHNLKAKAIARCSISASEDRAICKSCPKMVRTSSQSKFSFQPAIQRISDGTKYDSIREETRAVVIKRHQP